MKKICLILLLLCSFNSFPAFADAGEATGRLLVGPSLNIDGWENQFRLGGDFNYDLGHQIQFDLLALAGISSEFRFQLIPSLGYNFIRDANWKWTLLAGAGYGVFNTESGIDVRLATGLEFPLADQWGIYTDANLFMTAAGTPGTPLTFDWLVGLSYAF